MYRQFLNKFILIFFFAATVYSQVTPETQRYRDDELGDIRFRREGVMDGNQIRTLYYNNGEVAQWPFQPSGEWPKGTGQSYLDGVCVLIASEVKVEIASGDTLTFHPLETYYREWMDRDPVTGDIWGLMPVPNYANPESENPAISNLVDSWPYEWPAALDLPYEVWTNQLEIDGEPGVDDDKDGFVDNFTYWNGYFGRGVINSDFETFFVMDDSKDGEFARAPYNYFPIESMPERKGLGLRVETRGFQWSHVLAEDIIFWHYDIVNISDHDYDTTAFGFYTDPGVGGTDDSGDDNASYDTKLDIAYAFDDDGFGVPGNYPTGYYGYAYLESPGIGNSIVNGVLIEGNKIDDDEDGMVDEGRNDGIDNDGDWVSYSDLNGNGVWDAEENEPLNNDVGRDGVGPFDLQYTGPDEGEGDGQPTDGEPNFDRTDIDESDMIGLTSLSIYRLGDGGTGGGWPKDDEPMWLKMNYQNFDTSLQRANISMVFASGPFPLKQNLRERFSMALVFGANLEDMIFNKETVQQIYNANYNFSKPPLKPTLTAVPGDGKIFLYWNSLAEESRDPFLGFENDDPTQGYKKDFEGYMIYRSEEPEFNDIKIVTDSKGDAKFWKPIAQFDYDNEIFGPDPVGINGASFWRGSNTGLQHSYVDEDVVNGRKYYYAVVSYDQGDPEFGTKGLVPSECTKIITEDFSGNLKFVDINCAVIVPNAPSAGYRSPEVLGDVSRVEEGVGTGSLDIAILNPGAIIEGATYEIAFSSEGDYPYYETSSYDIIRIHNGATDTIATLPKDEIGSDKSSTPFDGMTVSVGNDTAIVLVPQETGWLIGESNLTIDVLPDESSPARNELWPADYELVWEDEPVGTTPFFNLPIDFHVINTTSADTVDAEIFDNDGDEQLSIGDEVLIIEGLGGSNFKLTWRIYFDPPPGIGFQPIYPQGGDIYRITSTKPYLEGDYFTYSTKGAGVDEEQAKTELDDIGVVPNPYVAQASWERRNLNQTGRGERRIDFINLPSECTIRIYTVSGSLVKTLVKDTGPADGTVSWDLVTEDGMDAAFGLYVYHVDAPNVGEHLGKFALIK